MIINGIGHGSKVLEPGDQVRCQGITCTIKKITFQEYWGGDGFYIEFSDTNGIYRNWKQRVDGGEVIERVVRDSEKIKSVIGFKSRDKRLENLCMKTMNYEERIEDLKTEYNNFLETQRGQEWQMFWKRETGSERRGDFGDYLYDFYPEMLQ